MNKKQKTNVLFLLLLCLGIVVLAVGLALVHKLLFLRLMSKPMLDFYYVVWAFLTIPGIWYIAFRMSITNWLRQRGVSKSAIKQHTKGWRNYWWYEELHTQYNLGALFLLNKLFCISYLVAIIMQICVGWIKIISIPLTCILCVLFLLCIAIWFFSSRQWSLHEFGVAFTMFAHKGKSKNWYGFSGVSLLWGLLLPAAMIIAQIKLLLSVWT